MRSAELSPNSAPENHSDSAPAKSPLSAWLSSHGINDLSDAVSAAGYTIAGLYACAMVVNLTLLY